MNTCALCGRQYEGLEGEVFTADRDEPIRLCHPADSTGPMTCFHRWTNYGERPATLIPPLVARWLLVDGNWHHVAIAPDPGGARWYVDGRKQEPELSMEQSVQGHEDWLRRANRGHDAKGSQP